MERPNFRSTRLLLIRPQQHVGGRSDAHSFVSLKCALWTCTHTHTCAPTLRHSAFGCFIFSWLQNKLSQKHHSHTFFGEHQRRRGTETAHDLHLFIITHTHTHTPAHKQSRADILGGVIPGVESLRSPCCDPVILGRRRVLEACRERKRLYIKNTFCPEAVSLHLYRPSSGIYTWMCVWDAVTWDRNRQRERKAFFFCC